ncbi:DinB family protein [bacterium]|nr:DinB family protein [bacterium]
MDAEQWRRETLRKMKTSRASTLRLFDRINARMMIKPELQGRWSIKDVFAHMVAWEKEACKRLHLISAGKSDRIYYYEDSSVMHRFNARVVSKYKPLSMNQLLREAAEIRTELVALLKKLPVVEIDNTNHLHHVSEWLPEFTYKHERDHRERIQKWISARNKDRQKGHP